MSWIWSSVLGVNLGASNITISAIKISASTLEQQQPQGSFLGGKHTRDCPKSACHASSNLLLKSELTGWYKVPHQIWCSIDFRLKYVHDLSAQFERSAHAVRDYIKFYSGWFSKYWDIEQFISTNKANLCLCSRRQLVNVIRCYSSGKDLSVKVAHMKVERRFSRRQAHTLTAHRHIYCTQHLSGHSN